MTEFMASAVGKKFLHHSVNNPVGTFIAPASTYVSLYKLPVNMMVILFCVQKFIQEKT